MYHVIYIAVSGTGDKQTGFCRDGINFKASIDTQNILRGFFSFKIHSLLVLPKAGAGITNTPLSVGSSPMKLTGLSEEGWKLGSIPSLAIKISGFKRLFPDSRKVDKEIIKKQALLAPATCTMINGLHKRVMAFFASCEQFRYSRRFDSWNENRSILILYMGSGLGHGERCNNV